MWQPPKPESKESGRLTTSDKKVSSNRSVSKNQKEDILLQKFKEVEIKDREIAAKQKEEEK